MNELKQEHLNRLDGIIAAYRGKPGALIPVLHEAQEVFGYLPKVVQARVSKGLRVSMSKVYGVVTFYHFFTMEPRGDHEIKVCMGTACYVRGANTVVVDTIQETLHIGAGEVTEDRKFSLSLVRCLGSCGLAPAMMIGEEVYGRLTPEQVKDILARY
ncbi:MAG: NAD(P)H-dependent oxidoreductase subunit E [Candidatus Latescibacteria bacterium]|nr:NAD(P)H-dependent oxidoreductase subunit E [Candidatus Latescibacterota bacterium]